MYFGRMNSGATNKIVSNQSKEYSFSTASELQNGRLPICAASAEIKGSQSCTTKTKWVITENACKTCYENRQGNSQLTDVLLRPQTGCYPFHPLSEDLSVLPHPDHTQMVRILIILLISVIMIILVYCLMFHK